MSRQGFRRLFEFDDANLKELNDMLWWLFSKVTGRVEMRDLSTETKKIIDSKAESEELNALGEVVGRHSTQITQTEEKIEAAAEAVETLDGDVEQMRAALSVERDRISAEVERASAAEGELYGRIDASADAIMLEVGKKADAGAPAAGVDTGGSGRVRVKVTSEEFDVDVPGEDGDFRLNETGGYLQVLIANEVTANNVAYRYTGPADVYVDPNATSEQIASGAYFRSLSDVFAKLNGRILDQEVLAIRMLGDDYGVIQLQRVTGGLIRIYGNGHALTGGLEFADCASRIYVHDMELVGNGSAPTAQISGGSAWVQWYGCTFNGNGCERALLMSDGGSGEIWECGLYNAVDLIYAGHACDLSALNNRGGSCTNFAATDGCTIKFSGTRPDGAWAQHNTALVAPADPTVLTVDYGTAQPSVPVISTASWNYLHSDSYADGWSWIDDDDVRQGYNGKRIYGVIWFDAAAISSALSGKTVNQASLRLYMHKGVGRGVGVSVQLYGTDKEYDGRSGAPALTASYGTIGTAEPGEVNEITIPAQAVADLIGGAVRALVLYSDDTEMYKDRNYSKNYAKFAGSTSADENTCPRLTVVYQ